MFINIHVCIYVYMMKREKGHLYSCVFTLTNKGKGVRMIKREMRVYNLQGKTEQDLYYILAKEAWETPLDARKEICYYRGMRLIFTGLIHQGEYFKKQKGHIWWLFGRSARAGVNADIMSLDDYQKFVYENKKYDFVVWMIQRKMKYDAHQITLEDALKRAKMPNKAAIKRLLNWYKTINSPKKEIFDL